MSDVSDEWLRSTSRPIRPIQVDTTAPNVARVWNYLVGGRDNFEVDRRAAKQLIAAAPVIAEVGPVSRAFLRRTVTYLAADAGIRQFIDIGTGVPTAGNTHEVVQTVNPACHVLYVNHDPVVLSHARALLRSAAGGVSFLDADPGDPAAVVAGAVEILDFTAPVAVILLGILTFFENADRVVAGLAAAVPSGSYLVIMQPATDEQLAVAARRWSRLSPLSAFLRDRATVERWFVGLDLVEPGVVEVDRWHPAPGDPKSSGGLPLLGAVARKR